MLADQTRERLNDPELVRIRDEHMRRLQTIFDGVDKEDTAFVLAGVDGGGAFIPWQGDPLSFYHDKLNALAEHADALRNTRIFRPMAMTTNLYGVHFSDATFGAKVILHEGQWQSMLLTNRVGELPPPDLTRNTTWHLAQQVAEIYRDAQLSVPFYGVPGIASVLNVGINLYGAELLVAMLTDPEDARHDLAIINATLMDMHRRQQYLLPAAQMQQGCPGDRIQPPGFAQICGCSTQLLSRELYRDFIAPLDTALLAAYPHGGLIHLCGGHTQHIPTWRGIPAFRAFQLNDRAAGDLAHYFHGLRDDQILYVNPCEEMPLERIMEITGGHRVVIVANLEMPPKKKF